MNKPRRARLNRRPRLIEPAPKPTAKPPTRENGGVFFGDAGERLPSLSRQISATLALIEARRLIEAARRDFESDGEAALAPSLLRYVDGVALELAKLRDELDGAQNGEGSGF